MEIEVIAKLDKKAFKDYMVFNFTHRRFFKFFVGLLAIALLFIVATIITSFVKDQVNFATFLPLIVLLAMFVLYFIMFEISVNSAFKKNQETSKVNVRYLFNENYIFINDEKKDIYRGVKIKYTNIFSVYENAKYFYLFINQQRSYILPKDKFTKGTYLELRSLLRDNIVCVYNQKCN